MLCSHKKTLWLTSRTSPKASPLEGSFIFYCANHRELSSPSAPVAAKNCQSEAPKKANEAKTPSSPALQPCSHIAHTNRQTIYGSLLYSRNSKGIFRDFIAAHQRNDWLRPEEKKLTLPCLYCVRQTQPLIFDGQTLHTDRIFWNSTPYRRTPGAYLPWETVSPFNATRLPKRTK